MRRLTALCVFVIPVVVIAASRPAPQELSAEDVAAIRAVLSEDICNALRAQDREALTACYIETAVEMNPGGNTWVGKPNISYRWRNMSAYNYTKLVNNPIDIVGHGVVTCAICRYDFAWHYQEATEQTTQEGTWVFTLRKQEDGSWKIVFDHWEVD